MLLPLAACGGEGGSGGGRTAAEATVPCRTGSAKAMALACRLERGRDEDGRLLTIRHPDGGFRRLRMVDDGRGLEAADGAEPARIAIISANMIEVNVAADSYRLPATIGAGGHAR